MSDAPLMVQMRHIRQARMCARGARAFFARHGLDWNRFLREGLPAEELLATGNAMAHQVVEVARGQR